MQTSTTVKFNSHHFPVGTFFKLNDDPCLGENRAKVFQVKSVVQSVDLNYLLQTTQPKPKDFFGDMVETFHICHVAGIVYRGTGPVVIETTLNSDQTTEMVQMIERSLAHAKDLCMRQGVSVGKNSIAFLHTQLPRVLWLYSSTQPGVYLDEDKIYALFAKSSFSAKLNNVYFGNIFIVKKKALKKWFKQNQNRFWSNVKKYQKKYDEAVSAMYEQELDIEDSIVELGDNRNRINSLMDAEWGEDESFDRPSDFFRSGDQIFQELDKVLREEETTPPPLEDIRPTEKKFEEDF
jgi:hypothetical protein